MPTYLRHATKADLPQIMTIIAQAKQLLKADGIFQWQNGKPNQEVIGNDIDQQQAYCLISDQTVAGVAILQLTPENSYNEITGAWKSSAKPYGTIHRIAIASTFRGQHLGSLLMSNLLSAGVNRGINNFRIDTHPDNQRMQGLIKQTGFQYRGLIKLDPTADGKRYAYELNLN